MVAVAQRGVDYLLVVAGEPEYVDFAVLVAMRSKRFPMRMRMQDVAAVLRVSPRTGARYRDECLERGLVVESIDRRGWLPGPAWKALVAKRPPRVKVTAALFALDISRAARLVLAKLDEDEGRPGDYVHSAASLARQLGMSERHAKRVLGGLAASGLLQEVARIERPIRGRRCVLVRRRVALPTRKIVTPGHATMSPQPRKIVPPREHARLSPPSQVLSSREPKPKQPVGVGESTRTSTRTGTAKPPARTPQPPNELEKESEHVGDDAGGGGGGGGGVLVEVPEEGRDLSQPMPPVSVTANGGDVDRIALLAESFSDFRPKTRRYAKTPSAQLAFDVLDAKRVGLEFAGLLLLAELGSELTEATLDDIERDRGVPTAMASASLTAALRAAEDDGFRQRAEHVGVTPDSWTAARECVGAA